MANVYVGFRYVPLFCGVWDNSKGYEALSVVTHNGGGYTSNKPVPAGIEPGTDNGEYWAYTYRAGGEASAIDWDNVQNKPSTYPTTWEKVDGKPNVFPTNWGSVEGKPQTFPPSTHMHEISQIDGLTAKLKTISDSLTSINNTLNSYDGEFSALEEELTSINNTVSTLSTNLSTLKTTIATHVNNIKRYVSNEGKNGIFNFRYWSDGFVELWAKVEISNLSVSTPIGNMYRSNSPITDTQYRYPYTFYPQPFVYTQFFTSINSSAFVWLNPTWGKATQYLPEFYLVRPTTGTCSGYVYYYICGETN